MRIFPIALAATALAACGAPSSETPEPVEAEATESTGFAPIEGVASGAYSLDPTHAFLTFKVGHAGGLSSYRVTFTDYDAGLEFDTANPAASTLSVSINPLGLETNYPGDYKAGHADSPYETWNEDLSRNPNWLNADNFPEITFNSTSVDRTGETTGTITGDLTFLGQTMTVTLDTTYNGVARVPWLEGRDIIGFDASTVLTRSEWGMDAYLPMIGDRVEIAFSGEFIQDVE